MICSLVKSPIRFTGESGVNCPTAINSVNVPPLPEYELVLQFQLLRGFTQLRGGGGTRYNYWILSLRGLDLPQHLFRRGGSDRSPKGQVFIVRVKMKSFAGGTAE
jgi:hypothetical protein